MSDQGLEALLRASALEYGHIQLFRDETGWQADICHYGKPHGDRRDVSGGGHCADPVDALRAVLLEDERIGRDLERRFAAATKVGPAEQVTDDEEFGL